MIEKPYAPSCDRNQDIILQTLKRWITKESARLLEVGSGTGQHAVYCAPHFPKLQWYVSDRKQNHEGIELWLSEFRQDNINGPLEFEIGKTPWPSQDFDIVFTANTLHIMSWESCKEFINMMGAALKDGAQVYIYGAFNYDGKYTSESNERFDQWLKDRDPRSV